ncbi:MAG: hypothetical protein AB1765_04915 [Candidatus Hydrogenedentota bacterium]
MRSLAFIVVIGLLVLSSGCFQATIKEKDPDASLHYDAEYDYTDLHQFTVKLSDSLSKSKPISEAKSKPIIVDYGIDNHTSEHIDMKAITDAIRKELIAKDQVDFVNITRRDDINIEADYMYSGKVDPSKRIVLGKQLGADYMLTGTMYSIKKKQPKQFRLKRKELNWYKLTLELTNIETSVIEWTDEVEIAREIGKPLIGW